MKLSRRLIVMAILTTFVSALAGMAGDDLKPIALDINTDADEIDPYVSSDGTLLLFSSNKAGTFDILLSRRSSSAAPFKTSKPFIADAKDDERSPFLYKGSEFYYATNHIPDPKLKDLQNFDIQKRVGERAPLPMIGISQREDELYPWILPNGKEFYFSRKTAEGWMLLVATGPSPGPVGNAKDVGFPVGFCNATINSAGNTMYLQGPLEEGRTGLFRSKRTSIKGGWSKPEPLEELNKSAGKRGHATPCLSGDRLYFSSDREGGKGGMDLWSVPVAQLK